MAPDGIPRIASSYLGLFCLPMSHKKDARLIWTQRLFSDQNFCVIYFLNFAHNIDCVSGSNKQSVSWSFL